MKRGFILAVLVVVAVCLLTPSAARAAGPSLPAKFSRVPLGSGMNGPTAVAFNGSDLFVTEKGGAIRIVHGDGSLDPNPFATFHVSTQIERGLLGIALDPNYASNGYLYIYYTTGPGAKLYSGSPKNRVARLKKTQTGKVREKILLDNIPSDAGNHNGGDIHFGFDGKLYIAVGDSGCDACHIRAQKLKNLRGKILRLNADGTIPPDNPFYNTPGARQEIYALGFRNPWRFGLRASNQSYIVADVGQSTWEEVDSLRAAGNYGWPMFEGPCPSNNLACNPQTVNYGATIKPIHWYNHSSGSETGNVIAGGVFAENSNYPAPFANAYFYGDGGGGWVHVLTMDGSNQVLQKYDFDAGLSYPVSFGNGPDGNIYVVDFGGGVIYKYVYTP